VAGDWLKFECNLPEKPETLAITAAMGWEDPDLTVGKLMRLFRWFDQHTINGNARSVTPALLDRIIGVAGFSQAVADSRWLVFDADGVTLQKFDRHNGASAKARVQTAKRVANHRERGSANADETPDDDGGNGASVTGALAREEKRREEKKTPKAPKGASADVPDWIPAEPWAEFVAMRRAKGQKAPFTVGAAKGILAKLSAFRDAGHDVAAVLSESVVNGWSDVYEPKVKPAAKTDQGSFI